MYNTAREAFRPADPCPSSHPSPQPFVWSYNDDKGYGTHANYVLGWNGDSLQRAIDSDCMLQGCVGSVLET
ncbi:hypothetical protein DL764_001611 [Monosporascus ibericus]|uniref:Uncharacterized protein n=1 Tax=Monosporascus ibericus TaxID=155417 RepID=A0A4Q4TNS3_9PEZI|nr:hypothetical protein DL764_001611 [Monosporascus ibericus]